jgi:hypothetical protein
MSAAPASSASSALGPGLALALALGFTVLALAATKTVYMHRRRLHSIHAPAPRALPLYMASSLGSRSSISVSVAEHSLGEFGALTSVFSGTAPGARASRMHEGVVVGMLGSPDWEVRVAGTVDRTQRVAALADAGDARTAAIHELPAGRLSRMSSRISLGVPRKEGWIATSPSLRTPSTQSPLLECESIIRLIGKARRLMHTSDPVDCSPTLFSPSSGIFSPRFASASLATSPASTVTGTPTFASPTVEALKLLDASPCIPAPSPLAYPPLAMMSPKREPVLPGTAPSQIPTRRGTILPPKARSLLDLAPKAAERLGPGIRRVVAPALPPKALARLGLPNSDARQTGSPPPPSPTWSAFSHSSLRFAGSSGSAAAGLGLGLPVDRGAERAPRQRQMTSSSTMSSSSSAYSIRSLRRKPVPEYDPRAHDGSDTLESTDAASAIFISDAITESECDAHERPASALVGRRVAFVDPPVRTVRPRAPRRSKSASALEDFAPMPTPIAAGGSKRPGTSPMVRKSASFEILSHMMPARAATPTHGRTPAIQVIEPTPVKHVQLSPVLEEDAPQRTLLLPPDWTPPVAPTAPSTDQVDAVADIPRTSEETTSSSDASTVRDSFEHVRGRPTTAASVRQRARPLDVHRILAGTTRPLAVRSRSRSPDKLARSKSGASAASASPLRLRFRAARERIHHDGSRVPESEDGGLDFACAGEDCPRTRRSGDMGDWSRRVSAAAAF